ncbi:sensor histidine kinase [Novispirillum sp. DQ9]|uniref:sensor histidine kinase n=1 Tax=Novispirillum sp. DQ9 TaxID=3398612 RepID=UPI003C7AD9B7
MSEAAVTPRPVRFPGAEAWRADSLLTRMVAGVLAIVALMTGLLFIGLDRLVTLHFSQIHEQRLAQYASDARRVIERETMALSRQAALAARDSSLNHSAQYHLLLQGEKRAVESDVDEIRRSFELDAITLRDASGNAVVTHGEALPAFMHPGGLLPEWRSAPHAGAAWIDGRLWLVAEAPLSIAGGSAASLQIGRPMDRIAEAAGLFSSVAAVLPVGADEAGKPGAARFTLTTINGETLVLEIAAPNPVAPALARAKAIIATALAATALLLVLTLSYYMRGQLRPLRELTDAAEQVVGSLARGTPLQVRVSGHGEVARLVQAFNAMLHDLGSFARRERQVREAEKLSAIGRVAARVAHDINNPITVIRSAAKLMLRDQALDAQMRDDLEVIVRHGDRCSRIVDNLLRFGRPIRLDRRPINLAACVRRFFADRAKSGQDQPYRLIAPESPVVADGDQEQLAQMFENLIANAYESNGGQEIEVEVGQMDRLVFIRIADHGRGFDPENIDRIFEFYFSTKGGGSGLGLPNAQAVAHAHGGEIRVSDAATGEVTVWLEAAPLGRDAPPSCSLV